MKTLRYRLIGMCAWFFLFYNIEKLFGVVNIAPFVYVLVLVYAVLIVLLRPFQRMSVQWVLLLSLLPYVALKVQTGRVWSLPIAVTEVAAMWITILLMRSIASGLESISTSIADLTFGHLDKASESFDTGQSRIYHEIRRARRFQRPASLLALSATDHSMQLALDRFIKDAQQELLDKYVAARVADFLAVELRDPNIILRRDDHYIVLMPEMTREDTAEVVKQLRNAAKDALGLEFQVGVAAFPDEAVTFESLLQNAEADMISPASERTGEMKLSPVNVNRALS